MMRYSGCSLTEAINMATRNPAKLYSLRNRGEIQIGKRADLVLFNMEQDKMVIRETILAGKSVYKSE
jgi:N-acetylglucosamine-6-phosphate deacetylase